MPSDEKLTPALPEDVVHELSFALRFRGRKRVTQGDELMARVTAERLVEHLRQSGFVIMRHPPGAAPRMPEETYRKP